MEAISVKSSGTSHVLKKLFLMPSTGLTSREISVIEGMNAYVFGKLSAISWGMPNFRPVIKYHKDPIKLRPVICKRNTPSINVGEAVCYALSKIM